MGLANIFEASYHYPPTPQPLPHLPMQFFASFLLCPLSIIFAANLFSYTATYRGGKIVAPTADGPVKKTAWSMTRSVYRRGLPLPLCFCARACECVCVCVCVCCACDRACDRACARVHACAQNAIPGRRPGTICVCRHRCLPLKPKPKIRLQRACLALYASAGIDACYQNLSPRTIPARMSGTICVCRHRCLPLKPKPGCIAGIHPVWGFKILKV